MKESMKKVVSLGEILLRLSPPNYQRLTQSSTLDCQFGGSEVNVLATLAQLGHRTELISAVPDNDLGKMSENFLFTRQIGTEHIIKLGERLGLYFYQKGYSIRPSRVLYDRKYSAFWQSKLSDYQLEHVFDEAKWFHVSGITAALTPELYELTHHLMQKARQLHIPISFDLNFRTSLWESFEQAREQLSPLVALADVCIGLEPISLMGDDFVDIKDKLQLKPPYNEEKQQDLYCVVQQISEKYQLNSLAFTERHIGHTNEYMLKSYLYHDGKLYQTNLESIQVLDRVGTGDAFTAGIIHGLLENMEPQLALDTAMACFKFKHTIEGDTNSMTPQDVADLLSEKKYDIRR